VIKGLLRNFGTAADGSESILQFCAENSWTLDAESYHLLTPSRFSIAAIERSQVLQWNKAAFDRLLNDIPPLNNFSQQLISHNNYSSRNRLFTTLSATAEEKYECFIKTHTDLLTRLPLHMIAAYIGISLKTLTRIRHSQLHR
jgi:CRP/FNR family transcriptional regulator, anaerobic regulatory protein